MKEGPKVFESAGRVEKKIDPEVVKKISEFKELLENNRTNELLKFDKVLSSVSNIFFDNKAEISLPEERGTRRIYVLACGGKKITIIDDTFNETFEKMKDPRIIIYGGDTLTPDSGVEIYTKRLKHEIAQGNSFIIFGVTRAMEFISPSEN